MTKQMLILFFVLITKWALLITLTNFNFSQTGQVWPNKSLRYLGNIGIRHIFVEIDSDPADLPFPVTFIK